MELTLKKHLKHGLVLLIESDGNFYTLLIRVSKKQLLKFVDVIIPDDTVEK